jgi:hypothetical protein
LKLIGVSNDPAANIEVKGDFEGFTNRKTGLLEVVIEVRFRGASGDNLGGLRTRYSVTSNSDVAVLTGATSPLDPRSDKETDNKEIQKRIASPEIVIEGTRVRSARAQPYAVQVAIKASIDAPAIPRTPVIRDGHAFVTIQPGELYEVHVFNESPHESAVTVSIDGLDSFYLDDGRDPRTLKPRYGHYMIGPGKSGAIIGWFRNLGPADPKRPADSKGTHDSFLVTDYGKGLSSRVLGNSAVTGQITVTFAASWEKNEDKPRDETGKGSTETTQGPPRTQESEAVKRNIGAVRDIITIRYDKR